MLGNSGGLSPEIIVVIDPNCLDMLLMSGEWTRIQALGVLIVVCFNFVAF